MNNCHKTKNMLSVKLFLGLLVLMILSEESAVIATPIESITIENFDDPWDYQQLQHNEPMLLDAKNHTLPQKINQNNKESFENEDELGLQSDLETLTSKISCPSCRLGLTLIRAEVNNETATIEDLKEKFLGVCSSLNLAVDVVCAGMFDTYGPVVLPALKICTLSSEKICALLLGEKCGLVDNPDHEWGINLPPEPERDFQADNNGDFDIWDSPPPPENGPVFKVLHLSDTHYDPEYQEGSVANCQEPLCCRNFSSFPAGNESVVPAGRYGSYLKCDTPKLLIDNMLEHITAEHKDIDYIIWTGDIPPHDIWRQTKEQTLANVCDTIGDLVAAFPGIPIFPTLGNHEGVPSGNFPPPWMKAESQSAAWIYEAVSREWAKWLPPETNTTLIHGGFYSVLIRPKFRLISLNMNYCHAFSWWLVMNSTDPAKELKWLVHELTAAERNDEKVHIIGHIPPGALDCIKVWSKNYYDIINRFRNTVVAQFFGHTHTDEFELFYDDEFTSRATAVAYIGPSVTTYENLNPGYRIYYVDGDHAATTREVVDHETWILDLDKANSAPKETPVNWRLLYTALADYGMKTLRPADWSNLINQMIVDDKVFTKFYRYFFKASPFRPPCKDKKCRFKMICDLKSGKSHDRLRLCREEEEYFIGKKKKAK